MQVQLMSVRLKHGVGHKSLQMMGAMNIGFTLRQERLGGLSSWTRSLSRRETKVLAKYEARTISLNLLGCHHLFKKQSAGLKKTPLKMGRHHFGEHESKHFRFLVLASGSTSSLCAR
mmetsp:Transcript_1517/g.3063  ORF Transcript_1517/g.3063 Transcript_1517/m.3063 type:complete len:117 (+) Transcript_1517:29-379(+)